VRKIIAKILRWQAKKYITKSGVRIVAVTGSVGKTSTTQAVATVLEQKYNIRKTLHNYNTDVGVPCSIFGAEMPSTIKNPLSWLLLIIKNQLKLLFKLDVDVFVLELGADRVGEINEFAWLQPDINIVTAIAPEHMEQFGNIEVVAKEELSATHFSDKVFINKHMVDERFLTFADMTELYNYDISNVTTFVSIDKLAVVGQHSLHALAAAVQVGRTLDLSDEELRSGLYSIKSQKGRMNKLDGINDSVLIDDTYNSSPEAVYAALDYVYGAVATQKIAILGNMNELGDLSESEHRKIGKYCLASELDLVVTLGPDTNKFTSIEASRKGCKVFQARTPTEAAAAVEEFMKPGALILIKGSQNNVFAEEVTKCLLKNPQDKSQLVRQSSGWMKKKIQNFEKIKP
jgi:UDP-N-acetylmuramoyl-tripeptide--D-alanyl-D-alanine ligase